ncbi:hypothetical protein V5799_012318 [Amblyomma americanum]|uniref:Uncharacterized protein n=1 Tax=Amblyomma americanum TaxID=6943 RepID=A0AAQ4EEC7_AMBAM
MATVTVTISGPLLATLIYEHCNSPGDQEGFLLGEITSRITDTISDAQLHGEKEETNLKICAIISCDLFEFYDKKCHLVTDKLTALLRDKQKEVVGWYRFRRNTSLQASLREQVLHQRAFKHYSAVPLRIVNLGEPGHSDYRMYPGSAASIHQGAFCEVLNSLPADGSLEMVDHMHRLHNLLHTKLREVLNSVAESEEDVAAFADDIIQLREKYGSLKKAVGPSTSSSASESISATSK